VAGVDLRGGGTVEAHPPRPALRLHNGTLDLVSAFFQLQANFLLLIVDYLATFVT
jgi:hypothetical protein